MLNYYSYYRHYNNFCSSNNMAGSALRTWHRSNEDLYQPCDVSTILVSMSHKKTEMPQKPVTCSRSHTQQAGKRGWFPVYKMTFKWQGRKAEAKHGNMKWAQEEANMAVQKTVQFSECIQQTPNVWPGNMLDLGPASVSPKDPHVGCWYEPFKAPNSHTFWGNDNVSWGRVIATHDRQLTSRQ